MNQKNLEKIINLRHVLHKNPELSMHEAETMETIRHFLSANTSLEIVDKGKWFYAVKHAEQADKDKGIDTADVNRDRCIFNIAFRADMDALPMDEAIELSYASSNPGVSHKCGHDGHAAALCGLALELDQQRTDKTVYLIFQPGEETGQGAVLCRDLVKEKHIDEIYAFHNLSGYPEKTVVYHPQVTQPASEGLHIKLTGKTSHAAEPEHGNNPSCAIASIVLYAQSAAQQISEGLFMCTITGIKVGNSDFGISPGEGDLFMTLRAEHENDMKNLEEKILGFAGERAQEAHLEMSSDIHDYFPETRNHDQCLEKVLEAADSLDIPKIQMPGPWRPSEDFGYYLKECPGAMFYIGNGTDYPPVHTGAYDFNDNILETAVDMFSEICFTDQNHQLRSEKHMNP